MLTHLPPPWGPTCGQWIYRRFVSTAILGRRNTGWKETYIWPRQGQDAVDGPADDVVAPGLAIVSVLPLGQALDTLLDAVPLLVFTEAPLLRHGADLKDAQPLEVRIRDARGHGRLDPGVQARDPRIVLED